MIDNGLLSHDEWQAILLLIVTLMFIMIVLFKLLSDNLHNKLDVLKKETSLLKPCPFCGSIPDVRNGYFMCKKCSLMMHIPFRYYKSVKDMVDQTWNKRMLVNK